VLALTAIAVLGLAEWFSMRLATPPVELEIGRSIRHQRRSRRRKGLDEEGSIAAKGDKQSFGKGEVPCNDQYGW
jgi:hypothetical protein